MWTKLLDWLFGCTGKKTTNIFEPVGGINGFKIKKALKLVSEGYRLSRKAWSGKEYIELVDVQSGGWVKKVSPNKSIEVYNPSQDDCVSCDWYVAPDSLEI